MNVGIDADTWLDHTDVRPTMMSLLGLSDDYLHDGRVLAPVLAPGVVPATLMSSDAVALGDMLKRIDAPFGEFGMNTLSASTVAITSDTNHDNRYLTLEKSIDSLTDDRDQVADEIREVLAAAAAGTPVDHDRAAQLLDRADGLLHKAAGLGGH
jgi:predicted transcriptional regulator